MDELLHFFKTKDVTNAPNILQGEPTYLPFTMRAKTLLGCISTGLDKTSCTATAQIIAYWLTGKKRVFGELMEGGLQLSQWNYEDVWLAPSPQLISIDMNSHKFSVVVLPTVGQAILLQSNQWPGEKYTYDQSIKRSDQFTLFLEEISDQILEIYGLERRNFLMLMYTCEVF